MRMFGWLMVGVCLLTLAAVDASAATSRSTVGTWKLDVAKSSYGNMPAPKFEQLVIMTDKADALKWNLKGLSADGKSFVSLYDGPIDGNYHPLTSNRTGSTVAYTRTASGVQWTTKDKSGAVIETGSGQLSSAGDTLTIKGTVMGPGGEQDFISVFQRVQ
ncbi:MAG: hypothetical protein ABSD98_18715 [Candidatus Korobacteraceae bacterium]